MKFLWLKVLLAVAVFAGLFLIVYQQVQSGVS